MDYQVCTDNTLNVDVLLVEFKFKVSLPLLLMALALLNAAAYGFFTWTT